MRLIDARESRRLPRADLRRLKFDPPAPTLTRAMAFQLVQIVYWLALATWFGGVMFVAVAAPVIFRTVRENNPVLTHVLSVNLESQHATLLAGSIVGNVLARLSQVELVCAIALVVALIGQFFVADLGGSNFTQSNLTAAILRCVLCAAAAAVVAYDRFVIWPAIERYRATYVDHADEPEVANPAKDGFDREHRRSMTLLTVTLGLLLLLIMYSSNITVRTTRTAASPPAGVQR
jgi:hypothetical protein